MQKRITIPNALRDWYRLLELRNRFEWLQSGVLRRLRIPVFTFGAFY